MEIAGEQSGQFIFKKHIQGGQQHPNPEFYLRVDQDAFKEYKKDPDAVPVTMIAEVNEILCNRGGSKAGYLVRPSHQELVEAFDTTDFTRIVHFMLRHGRWQPYGPHDIIKNHDRFTEPKNGRVV